MLGQTSGLLRLNVPRIAAEMVVQPELARFLATYPQVRLEVVSDDGLVDIEAARFRPRCARFSTLSARPMLRLVAAQ